MPSITNKTRRPLKVPLPGGKTLFLGPGKTGQVAPKALEHPPLVKLVDDGDLESSEQDPNAGGKGSGGGKGLSASEGHAPGGGLHRSGDR